VVEPGDDFDDAHEDARDDDWGTPLLPPDDRLWRHPSELGANALPISAEALSARRSWMAATPTRAGAWSAGIVGALLATGVVLIGGHLTHVLSPSATKSHSNATVTSDPPPQLVSTTTLAARGDAVLIRLAARVASAMPMVFVDHKPSGVGVVVSSKGYVLVPDSLITDRDDIGLFIDGQLLPATLVGADSGTGLAVVRVHATTAMTAARFVTGATSGYGAFVALVWVDASGPHTCWGTVDQLDVHLSSIQNSPPLLEGLQTFEAPGPVATGGVILDGAGRIMGMITSVSGSALIATPGWLANVVSGDIIASGRVVHGWLGIRGETASLSASQTAVKVLSVSRGSAAAKAGVKAGDLIESVNGEPTTTMAAMVAALYCLPPNRSVKLDVSRRGHVWTALARLTAAA
jgi:S1-C subfamily serine protease